MTVAARERTPSVSGIRVAQDVLLHGLAVDGELLSSKPQADVVRWRIGRRVSYLLRHPDHVDHVLHDGADAYVKSIEYEILRAVVGLSIFTDEGESWRRHRQLLNPVLGRRHLRGLVDLMVEPIEDFVGSLDGRGDVFELEMAEAMTALTLDVVGSALFGRQLGHVADELKRAVTPGLRGAEVAVRLLTVAGPPAWSVRAAASVVHHAPMVVPQLRRLQWVMRTVDRTVNAIVEERRRTGGDADDLLGLLLRARDEEGALSDRRVRDEAVTFMLAGHETTANALAWTWYLLSEHPQARERLEAEVAAALGDRRPAVEDLPALTWTTACFQEAMRLFPPAWMVPRKAVREDVVGGHRIPKGANVLIPIHAIHHDERWWPDPETFDPHRFLPGAAEGRHRSAYLPFGGGRRVCIGTSFALWEATFVLAMMSRAYRFDVAPGHPVEPEATLTLRPRHGLRMLARRREAAA